MTTKKQAAQALGAGDGLVAEAGAVDSARKAPALEPFDWRQHTTVEHDEHKDDVAAYLGRNPDVVAFLAMLRESVARHHGPLPIVLHWHGHRPGPACEWDGAPYILIDVVGRPDEVFPETGWYSQVTKEAWAVRQSQSSLYGKIAMIP